MNFLKNVFATIGVAAMFMVIWAGMSILGACLWIATGWNILLISAAALVLSISITVTWAQGRK